MNYDNILNLLNDSIWLSNDAQMETTRMIAQSILDGTNKQLAESFTVNRDQMTSLEEGGVTIRGGIAIVPLTGTIVPKVNMMTRHSGGTSAEQFAQNIDILAKEDSIHTILIRADSGGGMVHSLNVAQQAVLNARETKRVFTVVDHTMASAAFWIGSAAEKIFVTPTAETGSIGVMAVLRTMPKEEAQHIEIFRSVPGKNIINGIEPLTEEARNKIQSNLDITHASFVEAISTNLNIPMSKAKELANGETFIGKLAVEAGLADGVVASVSDLMAQIEAIEDSNVKLEKMQTLFASQHTAYTESQETVAGHVAEIEALTKQVSELETSISDTEKVTLNAEIEQTVSEAVLAGKLASASKEDTIALITGGDMSLSAFNATMKGVPANSIVPKDDLTPKSSVSQETATEIEAHVQSFFPELHKSK